MPIYEFESGTGHRVELSFPIGGAPNSVKLGRRLYVRVPSRFSTPIKMRHRAVGDDEDRAFKASAQEFAAHDAAVEKAQKERR